jgi:PKD domain
MRGTRGIRMILAVLVAALGGSAVGASSAVADLGTRDFVYTPLTDSATASKPESKLWFADGVWWSVMFQPTSGTWRIFRLDRGTQVWHDTGTDVDDRDDTRADTLWDPASNKLYVASHVFVSASGGTGRGARLYRYSYDPAADRYTLDPGFPATINGATSETLTLDRDSTGALWATWVQSNAVFVNRTHGSDTAWGTPYVVPGTSGVDNDDISSLVHFGGDRIGVMWSDQTQADFRFYFAVHADGTGDSAANWSVSPVPTGFTSDDHINLKADSAGRVYAALKTGEAAAGRPQIVLGVRSAAGAWTTHTVGNVSEDLTRPIVELDEQHGHAYVVMTCGNVGGTICYKRSPLSGISFSGRARDIIRHDLAFPPDMNDATSTKQQVNGSTGLVVMANAPNVDTYWHADLSLGSPAPPVAADFTSSAASGVAPLVVSFRDASTNLPTNWRWDFGDGRTSVARNPRHIYTAAGTYTVRLTAANASSSATRVKTAVVTVATAQRPPGGGGSGPGTGTPGPGQQPNVLGTGNRRFRIRLFKRNLSGRRVRLSGSVSPRLNGVRVTLLRRSSTGRWSILRRATLRPLGSSRSRFSFVVKRLSKTVRYRIVLPGATGRLAAQSPALKVKRRR